MYRVMLVDDEKYAVKGLAAGIDWQDLGFCEVLEAYDMPQAQALASGTTIDVALLDIEMPGKSGLELAEWLHENSPQTELIFLTGHANFAYAQQALEIGAFRYMLKPVDHEELGEVIRQVVVRIREEREKLDYQSTYGKYYTLWESQKPLLVDRFWQDLAAGRSSTAPHRLEPMLRQYDIPLAAAGRVLPILISIERWEMEITARDEIIMEYAVRKAAEELVLEGRCGVVVGERSGSGLILVYMDEAAAEEAADDQVRAHLVERCSSFIASCNAYFHCSLSCYAGTPVPLPELPEAYRRLLALERSNVSDSNRVILAESAEPDDAAGVPLPSLAEWAAHLEEDGRDALLQRVEAYFQRLEQGRAGVEALQAYYIRFSHMMMEAAKRKGINQPNVFAVLEQLAGASPVKATGALYAWSVSLIHHHWSEEGTGAGAYSSVVAKVIAHIRSHPESELGREQLAATVYLNPAYLSRIFRKETGTSLTEFIQEVKLAHAKKLLAESNEKVGSVAETIGYTHFSYFAKIFKKATGMSPHEYRKRYRKLK